MPAPWGDVANRHGGAPLLRQQSLAGVQDGPLPDIARVFPN